MDKNDLEVFDVKLSPYTNDVPLPPDRGTQWLRIKDMAHILAKIFRLPRELMYQIVSAYWAKVEDVLIHHGYVNMSGFGAFQVKLRPAKVYCDWKDNKKKKVMPPSLYIKFIPYKRLRHIIREKARPGTNPFKTFAPKCRDLSEGNWRGRRVKTASRKDIEDAIAEGLYKPFEEQRE